MANLIRGLSENGGVVFCGVDSTELVRRAEQLHTTSATCSAALGRLLTGASLMGAMLKDDGDKVTLRVQGGGPAGVLIACTDGTGNVKGCIDNPLVELPPKPTAIWTWAVQWAAAVCSRSSGTTGCRRSPPSARCRWCPARSPRT